MEGIGLEFHLNPTLNDVSFKRLLQPRCRVLESGPDPIQWIRELSRSALEFYL